MATGITTNPYLQFRYQVELEGVLVGGFSEVAGLRMSTEIEEYREGGLNTYTHKLPGATRISNLRLRRGLTDSASLWEWYSGVVAGHAKRKNGAIILHNEKGEAAWRWNFVNAYPVSWEGPDLRAETSLVAVESLELAHNGLHKG